MSNVQQQQQLKPTNNLPVSTNQSPKKLYNDGYDDENNDYIIRHGEKVKNSSI